MGATALGLAASAVLAGCGALPSTSAVELREFEHELAIPPLAESRVVDGTRVFDLTAQEGETEYTPGVVSETWGFDGGNLGPTLRARRGEDVAVQVTNDLDEATSVHWHGMHLPPAMDGGPHQEVEPGTTWRPEWTIDQPAATLWYHPHPHGATERHVYRGLAGLFLLDDDASLAAAESGTLPAVYGVDDVPVIVQDKEIDSDGRLDPDPSSGEPGLLGNTVVTNGVAGAYHEVTTERVRLRLLNGSTARTYQFGFDDRDMALIATDGGLLDEPVDVERLRLAPGERAEIVVAFEPGESTRLRSYRAELGTVAASFAVGGHDEFDVLELRAADRLTPSPEPSWPASSHADDDRLDAADASGVREFTLSNRSINGNTMNMSRVDEVVTVGDTEVWEVRNDDLSPHSFHVHDVQFEVLTVDGDPPPVELRGRKDTIYLEPHRDYRLVMRFEDYADAEVPYMYHCHMLLHEDEGMMGQFLVVSQ